MMNERLLYQKKARSGKMDYIKEGDDKKIKELADIASLSKAEGKIYYTIAGHLKEVLIFIKIKGA